MSKIESNILVSHTRTGNEKFWQAHVVSIGKQWYTQTSYWQVNKAGKKSLVQQSEPYEAYPKNVGRANETSAEEQALLEFNSMVTKQRDKGYTEVGTVSKVLPLPMLAQKFSDRGHKLLWPAWVQPKYNGQRMLFNGSEGWSRGGKYIIPEVIAHLQCLSLGGVILDGELILPGNVLLQETMKATKKFRPGVSDQLQYIVYDIVEPDIPFTNRFQILNDIVEQLRENGPISIAPTHVVNNTADVMRWHKEFVDSGFEGTIVRDDSDGYDIGHRSNQIQKYKDFVDAEFEIVDVIEGDGRFKGAAVFVCQTDAGKQFKCTPEGTMEHRRELFETRGRHIGKLLTIRYQELSADQVPLFPIGVDVRDHTDIT